MLKKALKYTALFLLCVLWMLPQTVRAENPGFASGDQILLEIPEGARALSAEAGRIGLLGSAFDPETPADSVLWTLQQQTDGSWILENTAGKLSLDEGTLGLTLNGVHDKWNITETEEGLFVLQNTEGGWLLTWFPGPEFFEVSQEESEFTCFRLHRLSEEPEETTTETTMETSTETTTESTTESTTETTTETATETTTETTTQTTTVSTTETTGETTTETTESPDSDLPQAPQKPDTGIWNLYFGQLHAHTADSDGVGTVAEAFVQASQAGLDFFAVTDHSDSFDNDKDGSLTDADVSAIWTAGKAAAEVYTDDDFVAIYGFEMSWNQGQGHISTFNTPGFLSRDQDAYKKYKDGMEAYFTALLEVPDSVSQFNHPGTFYGDFKAFSGYDPKLDGVISLMEVGSGAGAEYQTAYDAYIQALDKGWHLAPTNNHNNHAGQFGLADTGRTVILAENLTHQSLYTAMKAGRVYATEDADLGIYYTLDGAVMGSRLKAAQVGDRAELVVKLSDPTDTELGTVDVIGPGGEVAASAKATATVSFSLPAEAAYYFIRVTQPDGDIAVTAPVWIRRAENIGISAFRTATGLTRVGEEQTFCLSIANQEGETLKIKSVTLTDGEDQVIGTAASFDVNGYSETTATFPHTFVIDGVQTIRVRVLAEFGGEEREFTEELEISVLPVVVTSEILLDGTHGQSNTYGEFLNLAASRNISARMATEEISPEQLTACRLLVIPAPELTLEPEFMELVKNYVNSGGNLLLLGKAGGSEELNTLLEALGSSLRLNGDTARDDINNDGDPTHLYTANILPSDWTAGILEGQIFAHISGCTLSGETALVKSGTGEVLFAEAEGILVSGSDFLADAYVKKPAHPWALSYANRTIGENLLGITRTAPQIAPIGEVRTGESGRIYLVEGLVTAGTHNINTDFPGNIYLQDETGAIEARGYSQHGLELGRRVRILGCLGQEDGRPILDILQIELQDKETPIAPEKVSNSLDYSAMGDRLLQIEGTVTEVDGGHGARNMGIRSFVLRDETGREASVWVEEFILSGSLGYNHLDRIVREGNRVSVVGLCHLMEGKTVLRIRDCDEVVLLWEPPLPTTEPETEPTTMPTTEATTESTTEPTEVPTTEPTTESTAAPTTKPTTEPTTVPTTEPTTEPTTVPPTVPTTEPTTEPTTAPTTVPTTEATTAPTTSPTTEATTAPTTAPVTKPVPPAYPDNPATGDEIHPSKLLLTMAICCVLLGMTIKKGHP